MRIFILTFVALCCSAQTTTNQAVFKKVFAGITAASTSANVINNGQVMHLLTAIFPAAVAPVTGLQLRIEASYDNAAWFPISTDITTAPRLGNLTYQIAIAYAPYPFLRVRSLAVTSSPMDVWYSGQTAVTVSYIEQAEDRFIL